MKKVISILVALVIVMSMPMAAMAEDAGRDYLFSITSNGKDAVNANVGDVITVMLTLERTDGGGNGNMMYAMQDEIQYDSKFFKLVNDSTLLGRGVESVELGMRSGYKRLYMNYLSLSGGSDWPATVTVGSFQLEVIAKSGVAVISNENFLVSTSDGSDKYKAKATNLTVTVTEKVTVEFDPNGGTDVPSQDVAPGETVSKPENPTKTNYYFDSWYKDYDLTDAWDFDSDTVTQNTDLYAGWSDTEITGDQTPLAGVLAKDGVPRWLWLLLAAVAILIVLLAAFALNRKTVTFEPIGGTPVDSQRVKRNTKLTEPAPPRKTGNTFAGWHKDIACTVEWDFNKDVVSKNITLYAKWIL